MPPEVYGWQHLLYLGITSIIMFLSLYIILKYIDKKKHSLIIKITGCILLAAIIWNRVSICFLRNGIKDLLPGSFCGMSSLALALATIFLKKDSKAFHCLVYIGLLGGVLTILYPDFIGQDLSFFYPMTISGLVHHTITIFLVLLMLTTTYIKPDLKKWYLLPMGLSLYMTYGIFLITILGYNDAMYIYNPILTGTKLNWFYLGLIFLPFHVLFLFVWEYFKRRKIKNI